MDHISKGDLLCECRIIVSMYREVCDGISVLVVISIFLCSSANFQTARSATVFAPI